MCIITVMKMIREIKTDELNKLLELYTHLHELGVPEHSEHLEKTWQFATMKIIILLFVRLTAKLFLPACAL